MTESTPVRVGTARSRYRSFKKDARGNLLTLSAFLLVLGMMIMIPAVLLVNNMEHDTRRSDQGELTTETALLMNDFNETLQKLHPSGSMNLPGFINHSRIAQDVIQEEAALAGFYASVRLDDDPEASLYQRAHRCMGNDPDTSEDGVVTGWDNTTHELGIAGAVYEFHVTDTRRSITGPYYLRLFECIRDQMPTHAIDAWADPGTLTNRTYSEKNDERPMNLTETNQDPVQRTASPTIDPASLETLHWTQPRSLDEADLETAQYPSNEARNYIHFSLSAPQGMGEDDLIVDPEFKITASHNQDARFPQDLELRVYHPRDNSTPAITKTIGPLTTDLQTFTPHIRESPTGGENWTQQEIEDSLWELTVTGTHNPNRVIHVDHFNMTGGLLLYSPYRLNATVHWQEIPAVYTDHEVLLHTRIEPGTPGEQFNLSVRDTGPGGNSTWWNLTSLEAEQDAGGNWIWKTHEIALPLERSSRKDLEFRFTDLGTGDTEESEDEDTLQIDVLRVTSRFDADP